MVQQINEPGISGAVRHLFDEEVHLTGIMEYGVSWEDLIAGQVIPPLQGARFDISFEGELHGENIRGKIKGVDYLEVRADGKFLLNIYATILTNDGETIALHETGILEPQPDQTARLHLNMDFSTASEKYLWINAKQVWGTGQVNMAAGMVTVQGFSN